jgi:hypothetical protein
VAFKKSPHAFLESLHQTADSQKLNDKKGLKKGHFIVAVFNKPYVELFPQE